MILRGDQCSRLGFFPEVVELGGGFDQLFGRGVQLMIWKVGMGRIHALGYKTGF